MTNTALGFHPAPAAGSQARTKDTHALAPGQRQPNRSNHWNLDCSYQPGNGLAKTQIATSQNRKGSALDPEGLLSLVLQPGVHLSGFSVQITAHQAAGKKSFLYWAQFIMGALARKKRSRETATPPLDIPRACLFSTTTIQTLGIKASSLISSFSPPLRDPSACLPTSLRFLPRYPSSRRSPADPSPHILLLTQRRALLPPPHCLLQSFQCLLGSTLSSSYSRSYGLCSTRASSDLSLLPSHTPNLSTPLKTQQEPPDPC